MARLQVRIKRWELLVSIVMPCLVGLVMAGCLIFMYLILA